MKRIFVLILSIVLCLCLFGCKEAPEDSRPYTYYAMISYAMDKNVMDEAALKATGQAYYLKLYDDGTGKMKIDDNEPVDIGYDESRIWQLETPDLYATYTLDGDEITVVDGAFTLVFRKQA